MTSIMLPEKMQSVAELHGFDPLADSLSEVLLERGYSYGTLFITNFVSPENSDNPDTLVLLEFKERHNSIEAVFAVIGDSSEAGTSTTYIRYGDLYPLHMNTKTLIASIIASRSKPSPTSMVPKDFKIGAVYTFTLRNESADTADKIRAIKYVRTLTQKSLYDAKYFVEVDKSEWPIVMLATPHSIEALRTLIDLGFSYHHVIENENAGNT